MWQVEKDLFCPNFQLKIGQGDLAVKFKVVCHQHRQILASCVEARSTYKITRNFNVKVGAGYIIRLEI